MNDQPSKHPEDFNLFDPAVQSDPYDFYRAMHTHCPVHKLPQTGFYVISKYEDLRTALRDHETFSAVMERSKVLQTAENYRLFTEYMREHGWEHVPTLQRTDPPQHTRYRKIVDRMLGPRHTRSLIPRMQQLAHELIDKIIDRGTFEFVEDFGLPLPGIVIAEQIGLDASQYLTFKTWAENMLSYATRVLSTEEMLNAAKIEVAMQQHLASMLEERRKQPRADLMSALVEDPGEGDEPLSMHEIQNVLHQLISGGYETTTNALNHMMWQMIRFPEVVEQLRNDRTLIRNFVEECLRWESPVQGLWRTTKKDAELSGTTIPAGTMCMVRYAAGNRDAEKFSDPDFFDIHRDNASAHIAFSSGAHFCPGAMLARQEMIIGCEALLERLENFALAKPLPDPVHRPSINFIPMKELHISFTAKDK